MLDTLGELLADVLVIMVCLRASCEVRTVYGDGGRSRDPETFATVCVWLAGRPITLTCRQVAL